MYPSAPLKVLLVEDNPADARLTRELLREVSATRVDVAHVVTLREALDRIAVEHFDVVLQDLSLPDSHGLDGLSAMQAANARIPIVVLSGLDDQAVSIEAMQRGAQDYLVKGQGTGELIFRAIRYSIERKRAEIQLLAEKEKAVVANRAKTEFLANISHELRTPLNAVIGFSDLLRSEALGPLSHPQYKGYAEVISDSGKHLLAIINDILDIAKIEAGRHDLVEERVSVTDVLGACLRLIKPRAEEGRIAIATDLCGDLTDLRADQRMLKQIVLNLLSNAVKFTLPGGEVRVSTGLASDGRARIAVTDTGIGISDEDLPKVLLPFFQVDGSLSRKYEGTGLGLPLVKSMVELHGGSFELASALAVGTTATVWFPAERVLDESAPPARAARRP
jgi:signal transduction histidine kinase